MKKNRTMEKNQEKMQFLGFFGIYKESYMIMLSWWKIFSMITLTYILPLPLIMLFHMQLSQLIFGDISNYSKTQSETPEQKKLYETISLKLLIFILVKLVHFVMVVLYSLLSTSTVVFTVTSIHTGREVTFKKVTSVVPKVYKRLMITLLCTFLAFFIYNMVAGLVMVIIWAISTIGEQKFGIAIFAVTGILYFVGCMYLATVWQLANVVSVLEDSCGFKAMKKSNELIKGKKGLSMIILFILSVSFFLAQFLLSMVFVNSGKLFQLSLVWRISSSVLCVLMLCHLMLLMLVIQTVLYLVCKSYHHEVIDMPALPEQLEVDQGVYEPLKAKDVQQDSHV